MVTAPQRMCDLLEEEGYNPNSPTRSRKMAKYVVDDLLDNNDRLAEDAEAGELVYETEHEIAPSVKPKLVLGKKNELNPPTDGNITKEAPDEIWFAMSYASIMTRHSQNLNNRISEARLISFESYEVNPLIVSGSLILTNIAEEVDYEHVDGIRSHSSVEDDVRKIVNRFGAIEGTPRKVTSQLDAVGCIALHYDGDNVSEHHDDPAPQSGDQLYYPDFITKISNKIDKRFYNLPQPINATPTELIEAGEGRTIDFKREIEHSDKFASEAASLMNTDGGAILLGVNDDETICGLEDIDHTHHRVSNILYDYLDGDIDYRTERIKIDGNDVLLVRLPKSTQRLYEVDGKFYIRVGESKKSMRFEILQSFFEERFKKNPELLFNTHNSGD